MRAVLGHGFGERGARKAASDDDDLVILDQGLLPLFAKDPYCSDLVTPMPKALISYNQVEAYCRRFRREDDDRN